MSNKYQWTKSSYDLILRITVVSTNLHVKWHPLRDGDGRTYERYLKRLHDIADTAVQKRRRAQATYRRKRQRMMARSLRENAVAGLESCRMTRKRRIVWLFEEHLGVYQ